MVRYVGLACIFSPLTRVSGPILSSSKSHSASCLDTMSVHLQISHATCRSDAVATAVANRTILDNKAVLRADSPARSRGNTPQPPNKHSVISNLSKPVVKSDLDVTVDAASPSVPTVLSTTETDIKPTMAILHAADRLNNTVRQLREGSTDSTNSAGVKRKAMEEVDLLKEVKKEKA
jgi:hypothetical protein